jgi:hypothetical protein
MTLFYEDPELGTVALKSRTLSDEHIGAHDIVALPGTVETDIGQSRGFLGTLAGAVTANIMSVALQTGANVIGKLAANAGVNIGSIEFVGPATGTVTAVASSVSVVTLLAANAARVGAMIYNSSTTGTLYVKLGSAASLTSWSVQLDPGGYWEMPRRYYTGIITGIWTVASGDAKVTETA